MYLSLEDIVCVLTDLILHTAALAEATPQLHQATPHRPQAKVMTRMMRALVEGAGGLVMATWEDRACRASLFVPFFFLLFLYG